MYSFNSVLLIDASEIDVLVNKRLIELTSFASSTIITNSAEEALKFLMFDCDSIQNAPDWIFLDMALPGMNGFDFIESFRNLPDFIKQKSKIVILSVFQKNEDLQKVLRYKFVAGKIDKPLTQQVLVNLIENRLINTTASS